MTEPDTEGLVEALESMDGVDHVEALTDLVDVGCDMGATDRVEAAANEHGYVVVYGPETNHVLPDGDLFVGLNPAPQ